MSAPRLPQGQHVVQAGGVILDGVGGHGRPLYFRPMHFGTIVADRTPGILWPGSVPGFATRVTQSLLTKKAAPVRALLRPGPCF